MTTKRKLTKKNLLAWLRWHGACRESVRRISRRESTDWQSTWATMVKTCNMRVDLNNDTPQERRRSIMRGSAKDDMCWLMSTLGLHDDYCPRRDPQEPPPSCATVLDRILDGIADIQERKARYAQEMKEIRDQSGGVKMRNP